MKGSVIRLTKVFDGASNELVIPVYQRNYDWQERHCERLIEDLEEIIAKGFPTHFFGAVVCTPENSFRSIIIDGQQRITTTSLLMLALVHGLEAGEIELDPTTAKKIRSAFLMKNDDGDEPGGKIKLKPVKNDQEAYNRLFGHNPTGELIERSTITMNYRFFRKRLQQSPATGDDLWAAIEKLEVMFLDLEPQDDPQRIFESLNSTGLALAEADKIRNAILMGQDQKTQNLLYTTYWNRIEENVGYNTSSFIRHYLTTKLEQAPRKDRVYEAFQKYRKTSGRDAQDILAELLEYSISLRDFSAANTGIAQADMRIKRFQLLGIDVMLPFILPVLTDVRHGRISKGDFEKTITVLDSYIARRLICGIQTSGLNKVFAVLYRELNRRREKDVPFADVLIHSLINRHGAGVFPTDDDVAAAIETRPLYKIRSNYRAYLFHCLENTDSKDLVDVPAGLAAEELSIEHIMPQTLTKQWKEELGPEWERIHTTWLHRLANLTITGYNSSYSNRTFEEKLTMKGGFKETAYRLNDDVRKAERWGEEQLVARTATLTRRALGYWPQPTTPFVPMVQEFPTFLLSEDVDPVNLRARSYNVGDGEQPVKSWKEMLIKVCKHAAAENRDGFLAFVTNRNDFIVTDNPTTVASDSSSEIIPGVRFKASKSAADTVGLMRNLYSSLGLDPDELSISVFGTIDDPDTPQPVVPRPGEDLLEALIAMGPIEEATSSTLSEHLQRPLQTLAAQLGVEAMAPTELSQLQSAKDLGSASDSTLVSALVQVFDTWATLAPAMHELIVPTATVRAWVEELHRRFG